MPVTSKYQSKKSLSPAQWDLKPPWPHCHELAHKLNVPDLLAQLLYNRGITDDIEAEKFLNPSLSDLIEPDRLGGIKPAVKRIQTALEQKQKIVLYGDYDVDGITGVAILWHCLKLAGTEVEFYVPHRIDEGYGLNPKAVEQLAQNNTRLIVSVDCGITDFAAADVARQHNVDLIITDHHKMDDTLPHACAIVHPLLKNQNYPNKNLCGAAVALKLAWAIAQQLSGAKKVSPAFRDFLLNATSFAALGTIADVVPLLGENRALAKFGLQGLANSQNLGIKALIKAARLEGAKLDSTDIGFQLAPRLNAAGRMGHARLAAELFTGADSNTAEEIAKYLESQNTLRKKVEKEITAQAIEQLKSRNMDQSEHRGIVLAGENWHAGVIGIVASRIIDLYYRPTIVIAIQPDKATGSCRSIEGFDITRALQACSKYLVRFGGHHMAAGITLEHQNIEPFRNAFNNYLKEHLPTDLLTKKIHIDAEVTIDQLNLDLLNAINKMAPFGRANPQPLLMAKNLKLVGPPRKIGKKADHLQFNLAQKNDPDPISQPGHVLRTVAFHKAKWEKKLLDADAFDLIFEPKINHFNGRTTVELIARDAKFH